MNWISNKKPYWTLLLTVIALVSPAISHDLGDPTGQHPQYDRSLKPPFILVEISSPIEGNHYSSRAFSFDQFILLNPETSEAMSCDEQNELAVAIAEVFGPFAPKVKVRWDNDLFYVESDGFPGHRMMTGITAWQQQVPIPQKYFGANAWRFPLRPVAAKMPLSAKEHFFRGAIAIAANGVPIFNPIKNDGRTDTYLAGELDEFGGHAGRADDYHYHIAPLHLQPMVGKGKPIAYALDGYPIFGLAEPDGSAVSKLDSFNGHYDPKGTYHYHSTRGYPYINGGFHGEVIERDGQVDPQPRANGVRPATTPLRGATITGFTVNTNGSIDVTYTVNGEARKINYKRQSDGSYRFEFFDGSGRSTVENYSGNDRGQQVNTPRRDEATGDKRIAWIIQHASEMDTNRDGVLTKQELTDETNKTFSLADTNKTGKLEMGEVQNGNVRSAMGGFLKQHAKEIDVDGNSLITTIELLSTVTRMFEKADADHDGKLSRDETKDAAPMVRPKR